MRRHQASPVAISPVVFLLFAVPHIASAYVDPGSGAMLWQVAAASILGSLFYLRKVAGAIRKIFGITASQKTEQQSAPPTAVSGD